MGAAGIHFQCAVAAQRRRCLLHLLVCKMRLVAYFGLPKEIWWIQEDWVSASVCQCTKPVNPMWPFSCPSSLPRLSASSRNICSCMNGIKVIVGKSNDVSDFSWCYGMTHWLNLITVCSSRWFSMQKIFLLPLCCLGEDRCFMLNRRHLVNLGLPFTRLCLVCIGIYPFRKSSKICQFKTSFSDIHKIIPYGSLNYV